MIFPHKGHVKLYIGNGKVIHAPQTGDIVKIAPLGDVWRARRIISNVPKIPTYPLCKELVVTRTAQYRSGAGDNYAVNGTWKKGDLITAIDQTENWWQTSAGWIKKNDTKDRTYPYPFCIELLVTRTAQYRQGPGEEYAVNGTWGKGAQITAIDESGNWWQTTAGWINKNDTKEKPFPYPLCVGLTVNKTAQYRQGPGENYAVKGSWKLGDHITAIDESGNWWQTTAGWINKNDTSEYTIIKELLVTRTAQYRKGPGENYAVNGTWKQGDKITAIDQTDSWWKTRAGWIKKNDTKDRTYPYPLCIGLTVSRKAIYRQAPNEKSVANGTWKEGDHITAIDQSGDWWQTTAGWINKKDTYEYPIVKELVVTRTAQYRQGPGETYGVNGTWKIGDKITAIEETENWFKTTVGWVKKNDTKDRTNSNPLCVELLVTRTAQYRQGPGENYAVNGTWEVGAQITAKDQNENWWQTSAGWIKKNDTKEKSFEYPLCVELLVTRTAQYRQGPGEDYAVNGTWKLGDKLTAINESGNWWQTTAGWINKNDTKEKPFAYPLCVGLTVNKAAQYRQGPGENYAVKGTWKLGDRITAIDERGNWWQTTAGWINKNDTVEYPILKELVVNKTAQYRKGPGENYAVNGTWKQGDKITAIDETKDWWQTRVGWIKKNDTSEVTVKGLEMSSFKPNLASPQVVGTGITLSTSSVGGSGTLKTKFELYDGSKWTILKDYSAEKSVIWKPSKAGTYKIKAIVKDSTGKIVFKTISYVVK